MSHHRANKRTIKRDYEYYITYLAHERRNDRWLPEIGLKIDEQLINDEQERIEEHRKKEEERNQAFMSNDVHLGMQPNQIQEFFESTKFKTIEYICIGDVLVEAWYYSPLPKEFHRKILYVCPFCL